MRIMHAPIEIAGQIGALCGALVRSGHFARGYNFFTTYLGYKEYLINTDMYEMGRMFEKSVNFFDLFHYHYGLTIFPKSKDLEILHEAGKPIVMHHWGNDVRMGSVARPNNPYVYTGDSPPEQKIMEDLGRIRQYVSDAIVQDHEVFAYVQPYYRRVHVIPLAIDLSRFEPSYPQKDETEPLVIHAPTNKDFKGTSHIELAIDALRKEIPFRYVRIEKMPYSDAVKLYKRADIIIDQILCGSYGLFSVEGMAYGKPVIAYLREDLLSRFEIPPPINNANPDTIYGVLKGLLLSPEQRVASGMAGRRFVENYHDSHKVVEKLLEVYRIALKETTSNLNKN